MDSLTIAIVVFIVALIIWKVNANKKHNANSPIGQNPSNPPSNPTPSFCEEYLNNTGNAITGVNFNGCDGAVYTNYTVDPNQSICVEQGTLSGVGSGFLVRLGNC